MHYGGDSDVSEDIFSDDEGPSEVRFVSPDPRANSPFFNLSQTPVLFHEPREETPGKPIVPKTPLTLVPFISKAEEWTHDMETPESTRDQFPIHTRNPVLEANAIDYNLTQTAVPVFTPPHLKSDEVSDDIVPLSQEWRPRKKPKRPPKRRIFDKNTTNYLALHEDNESDEAESEKVRKSQSLLVPHSKSPLQKFEKLKEFQRRLREKKGLETLTDDAIPDEEFLRGCRDLEMCDRRPQIQRTPSTSSGDSTEDSPTWQALQTLQQERDTQETTALTPGQTLETHRHDNYSQIDLGIDHIEEEEEEGEEFLEKTFILDDEDIKIKEERETNEEPEDGFRGFSQEEQESKKLWEFQRMFVLHFEGLSPKKLNFPGFSFVEAEISKTIYQNNEIFLNNYLEKYYGIRNQVDPVVITIEDTESEESQATKELVQLQLLPPLLMPVYSGFDTASGKKLFISVDKIFEEKTKLQQNEPSEMTTIDLLINNQDSTKVQISISDNAKILDNKSIGTIPPSDKADDNMGDNILNRIKSLPIREKCDNLESPPLNRMESVAKVAELPHEDHFPGCGGPQILGKALDKVGEASSRVDDLFNEDCLTNVKSQHRSLRLTKTTIVNQRSKENCDPKLTSTASFLRVPDPNDERVMDAGIPRDVTSGCENNSIPPPPVKFPQLRNSNCSSVPIGPTRNDQFPGFVTGTGRTAQISEKAWSTGRAMFAEAEKEVVNDVRASPPLGSAVKWLNGFSRPSSVGKPGTPEKPVITANSSTSVNAVDSGPQSPPSTSKFLFESGNSAAIHVSENVQSRIKASMQEFSLNLDAEDPELLELLSMKKKLALKKLNSLVDKPFTPLKPPDVKNFETPERVAITSRFSTALNGAQSELQSTPSTSKPTIGFKTGNGVTVNLSEAVQQKIKASMHEFALNLENEDPDLQELSSMKNKMWVRRRQTADIIPLKSTPCLPLIPKPFTPLNPKRPEPSAPNPSPAFGFTTAGGGSIKLSEAALERMKAAMEAYTPEVNESDVDFSDLKKKVTTVRHKKLDPSENNPRTPTARPDLALKRTSLPFMSKPFTPLNVKRPEVRPKSIPSVSTTAVGDGKNVSAFVAELADSISVPKNRSIHHRDLQRKSITDSIIGSDGETNLQTEPEAVQRKIQDDFKAYNAGADENDPMEHGQGLNIQNENPPESVKRKNPSDDITPFGRKRARTVVTDLQARILFSEINEEDEEIIQSSLTAENNCNSGSDRIIPFESTTSKENKTSFSSQDVARNSNRPLSRWSDSSYPQLSSSRIERRPYSFPTNPSVEKSKAERKHLTNPEIIPDDIVFDSQDFLESYEKISTKIKLNEAVERRRSEAIMKQEALIERKGKSREQQTPGSLLETKQRHKSQMIPLEQLCLQGTSPAPRELREFSALKIDPAVNAITSSTAENYQFNLEELSRNGNRTSVEISVGDGGLLIPNENNLAGITEFRRSFLATPGVDPTLVPNNWVENHYKWIVWKLAAMDRLKFSFQAPTKHLTPDRVLKQLKYRYDREIDRAERPVIRRILEKDEAPSRRMILCVSRIKRTTINQETTVSMELTDGWYSIGAAMDTPMINNILAGKIKEGTKLMIYGAQLMNIEEGCHPLEAPSSVRLKIHTNSTRRARWFTKLGLQKYSGPMELSLRNVHPNAGLIGKVSAVVSRLYPIIYKETTADGQVILRNARSEERTQMALSKNRTAGSISLQRNVLPLLKIRITDGCANGIITIWQNAEECTEMFKEGNSISIVHGTASGKRSSDLQISATRWTTFDVRCGKKFSFPERIFTPLSDTITQGFSPNYGEFDTVGIVVSIGPAPHGMKNFETVYLAYRSEKGEDSFLSILFWEGVAAYGYSDIATIGSTICCVNCEWRRNTYRSIPTAFCSERTIITRNPRQGSHLRSDFEGLRYRIGDISDYVDYCAARIHAEVMKKSGSFSVTPGRSAGVTPKDRRNTAIKGRLEKLQGYGPVPKLSPINLAGSSRVSLDFKSPFSKSTGTELAGRR